MPSTQIKSFAALHHSDYRGALKKRIDTMSTRNTYPEYAAIEQHMRRANIERVAVVAKAIAGFIVACRNAVHAPPRNAAVIINGRYQWAGIAGRRSEQR
jgi:hypothetical protein